MIVFDIGVGQLLRWSRYNGIDGNDGEWARIHGEAAVVFRRSMRAQGWVWRGPDPDEMDDVGSGYRARGMLTAFGSGAGVRGFQRRLQAGAVRSSVWRGWAGQSVDPVVVQMPKSRSGRWWERAQPRQSTSDGRVGSSTSELSGMSRPMWS